ncbi:MAG: serine/threonine protein kinase [Polyangiaceae bacterium]|nr:serine/threonine protein kinase [Polyangiaceae bacterium]
MSERLPVGHVVSGRYEVVAPIGEGPMGEVVRARDQASGAVYALKSFRRELAGTPAWAAFLHEAQRVAEVPGVLRVWDAGVDATTGAPFVLTALAEGPSLAAEVSTSGPLTQDRAIVVVKGAAAIASALHGASVVHRGLVPSNVFTAGTSVSVSDVGVAGLRAAAPPPSGPIAYGWAPAELAQGAPPSPSMDVWSLGVLLFFALTGKSPFSSLAAGSFDAGRLWAEMTTELPALSARARELGAAISPQLDPFFARALAVSPGARYASAEEAAAALGQLTARKFGGTVMLGAAGPAIVAQAMSAQGSAPPAAPPQALGVAAAPIVEDDPPPKKKSALPLVLGGLGALVVLGGIVTAGVLLLRSPDAPATEPASSASVEPTPAASAPPAESAPAPAASAPAPAPTTARVTFTCTPECDELACDGKPVEGGAVELSPGKHSCVGKKKDHLPATDSFTVKAGDELTRALSLSKTPDRPTTAAPPKKKCGGVFIKDCK